MDKPFQVKNDKGLFVQLQPRALVSVETAMHLRSHILPAMAEPGTPEAEAFEAALDKLQALPLLHSNMHLTEADSGFDRQKWEAAKLDPKGYHSQTGAIACHGWHQIGAAIGASNSLTQTGCRDAKEAGWLDIGAFNPHCDRINAMLAKVAEATKIRNSGWWDELKGAKTAAKRGAGLVFERQRKDGKFFEATSYLIFMPGQGYLDDKGGSGPLARARGFETVAGAARLAGAQLRRCGWKIVEASTTVVRAIDQQGDSPSDEVDSAVAQAESRALKQALESASAAQLRERLASLEALGGSEAPAKTRSKGRL